MAKLGKTSCITDKKKPSYKASKMLITEDIRRPTRNWYRERNSSDGTDSSKK